MIVCLAGHTHIYNLIFPFTARSSTLLNLPIYELVSHSEDLLHKLPPPFPLTAPTRHDSFSNAYIYLYANKYNRIIIREIENTGLGDLLTKLKLPPPRKEAWMGV